MIATPPLVRPAEPDDLDAVAALEVAAFGDDAWSPALLAGGIAGVVPTVRYRVAVADVVVGMAVVSVAGDLAELQRLAVDAEHRRAGVATALLTEVAALATAEGADRLLIEVREGNSGALAFYEAHDFVEIDRRLRYYRDGSTGVVMQRPLPGPATGR